MVAGRYRTGAVPVRLLQSGAGAVPRNSGLAETFTAAVERQGTYTVVAATVRFRWRIDNDPILTHYTQDGIVSGDLLHFVSLVHSEANPNGVETVWAKFRRR